MERAMPRRYATSTNRTGRNVFAWSALGAIALLLASLVQVVATRALVEPAQSSSITVYVSPATSALADGDDQRARFLASIACDPSRRVCSEW
jgi:hypothetical protein